MSKINNQNIEEQLYLENELLKAENISLKEKIRNAEIVISQLEQFFTFKNSASETAHEINNPINFIKGSTSVIERGILEYIKLMSLYRKLEGFEAQPGYKKIKELEEEIDVPLTQKELVAALETINKGIERIQEVTYNLSLLSRGQQTEHIKIDINESIKATLFIMQHKFVDRIEVYKNLGDLPLLLSKKGKLNQVFTNLIKNSIEAIEEKGELGKVDSITIQTRVEDGNIVINIKDTGVGMSEETKEKVFEKFYTTKKLNQGTGLGMSVVKEVIEAHKGKIVIKSELGKGTEFIIYLPFQIKDMSNF